MPPGIEEMLRAFLRDAVEAGISDRSDVEAVIRKHQDRIAEYVTGRVRDALIEFGHEDDVVDYWLHSGE